jgi:starch synthase
VAAECRGLAKIGGLGDVVFDLAQNLTERGHDVSIVLPSYESLQIPSAHVLDFLVPFGESPVTTRLLQVNKPFPIKTFLVDGPFFRGDWGEVYIDSQARQKGPFEDDALRFAYFCRALHVLFKTHPHFLSKEIVHLHDWHTGFLPLLLRLDPPKSIPRTLFTIHNLDYQGIRPWDSPGIPWGGFRQWFPDLWEKLLESPDFLSASDPRYLEGINPMRCGIQLSLGVSTVSPTYAQEITQADDTSRGFIGGRGLEKDLAERQAQGRLWGILNGLDEKAHDPHQAERPFSAEDPELFSTKRALCNDFLTQLPRLVTEVKARLGQRFKNSAAVFAHLEQFLLESKERPLFAMITRAASQKLGLFLEPHEKNQRVADLFLERPLALIVIASGEREEELNFLNTVPNALFLDLFDAPLAEKLYTAASYFLMPSDFEPCGLSQLIAMRYGTPPLVHDRGGLHDTVQHQKTGLAFSGTTRKETRDVFLQTVDRACQLFSDGAPWEQLARNAMKERFTWEASIDRYLELYTLLRP